MRQADGVPSLISSPAGLLRVEVDGPATADVVVLSAGLGGGWFDWPAVVRLLAADLRVVCFDRPGTGDSGPALAPPSLAREVAVLDAVLDAVGAPRAVLVGHSIAGLHVEGYARLRPERVAGAVLLDPSPEPPGVGRPFDGEAVFARMLLAFGRVPGMRRLGRALAGWSGPASRRSVLRTGSHTHREVAPLDRIEAVYRRPEVIGAILDELAAYPDLVAELEAVRAGHPLPELPWLVLTAAQALGKPRQARRILACHARLARLVPGGAHELVQRCGHMMPLDRPDTVAEAVRRVKGV
ncbi:alpha/beta fold hydrolase [Crossiella cryophila]|uniref:Pimeloyl-ACP methyl ester carboxylesterase n=1 Tax=Crossiella cryophila TaxID=43355 RepID=A0A7W7C8M2_9PSEU|nr:alpha/beta hydrolase [Crossiella cryophila]MBB4676587.1 pimeloyl-ACP methyl ester carboxylesterase [Crossiella cryophila]